MVRWEPNKKWARVTYETFSPDDQQSFWDELMEDFDRHDIFAYASHELYLQDNTSNLKKKQWWDIYQRRYTPLKRPRPEDNLGPGEDVEGMEIDPLANIQEPGPGETVEGPQAGAVGVVIRPPGRDEVVEGPDTNVENFVKTIDKFIHEEGKGFACLKNVEDPEGEFHPDTILKNCAETCKEQAKVRKEVCKDVHKKIQLLLKERGCPATVKSHRNKKYCSSSSRSKSKPRSRPRSSSRKRKRSTKPKPNF